ncbi:hypothetical protein ACFLYB_04510 [Chloroflexota bacterium]
MLDKLFPEQYVEGINECESFNYDENPIVITQFLGTGIQYIPKTSYSLTRLQIVLVFGELPQDASIEFNLQSDYGDEPSDIVLRSANFVPVEVGAGWKEIKCEPVSLVKGRKYWLAIHPKGCPTVITQAVKGDNIPISFKALNRWKKSPDVAKGKIMLRFFGRIFPVSN